MNTSEWLNIIFGTIGVFGVGLSIWFYIKQKEDKEPQCYYKNYENIVKLSNENKLKILYGETPVDRVSTSYIFIWNKGRKPIRKEDIPAPLMLTLQDKHDLLLLEYKVIKASKELINFSVHQCNKRVLEIHFDFLDKDDGAVIEIKHTGSTDAKPEIVGAILGVPEGINAKEIKGNHLQRSEDFIPSKVSNSGFIFTIITVLLTFAFCWYILIDSRGTNRYIGKESLLPIASIIVMIIILFLGQWVTSFFERPPYPKSLDIDVDTKPY